jgi:uncharacterized protein (TIGR00730 family)
MKAICVYCGSSPGNKSSYAEKAKQLGEALASRGLSLVYGGSKIGLMGQLADSVLAQGGRAIGILPEALSTKEVAHPGLSELHIVRGMHERKAKMAELADAFIALPGGFGTLDETMEMITWNQLGFQAKPIGFLNVDGFYDPLFNFISGVEAEGFVKPGLVEALVLESDPKKLVEKLVSDPWPELGSWPRVSK